MTTFFRFAVLGFAVTLLACQQSPGGADKVAVLDMNLAAEQTGQDVQIREKVAAARNNLTEQLRTLLTQFEAELTAERGKLGDQPAEADMQRIQGLAMQAQQQMNEAQSAAQNQVAALESQLAQEFSDILLPLAEAAAQTRGANLVLLKDAYLFWSEASIDITADVIAAWDALPASEKQIGEPEAAAALPAADSSPAPAGSDAAAAPADVEQAPAETEPAAEATP